MVARRRPAAPGLWACRHCTMRFRTATALAIHLTATHPEPTADTEEHDSHE